MNPRETQLFISLIETAYEETNATSFASTVIAIESQYPNATHTERFRALKREYGPPGGNISRVVSKQVFEQLLATDCSVFELIHQVANQFETQPAHLSDDLLCRGLHY